MRHFLTKLLNGSLFRRGRKEVFLVRVEQRAITITDNPNIIQNTREGKFDDPSGHIVLDPGTVSIRVKGRRVCVCGGGGNSKAK